MTRQRRMTRGDWIWDGVRTSAILAMCPQSQERINTTNGVQFRSGPGRCTNLARNVCKLMMVGGMRGQGRGFDVHQRGGSDLLKQAG